MSYFSELHAEGPYRTCGEADEVRRFYPEEYAMATAMSNPHTPDAYELVDALADVGITASVQYPYVIIDTNATDANTCVSPDMIAWTLNIDPALCCYNLNGNIRIRAD